MSFTSLGAHQSFLSRTRRLRWVDSLLACNPVDRVVIFIKFVLGLPHCSLDLSSHFLRDSSSPTVMGVLAHSSFERAIDHAQRFDSKIVRSVHEAVVLQTSAFVMK